MSMSSLGSITDIKFLYQEISQKMIYIFIDEGGDLGFLPGGSDWFVLTSVATRRPFTFDDRLGSYRYDCLEYGLPTEYFHCADDNAHVRRRVFGLIADSLDNIRIDTLVVEKRKVGPALREEKRFYPEMLGYLLRYVVNREAAQGNEELMVITDTLPLQRKRMAVEKAIKQTLGHRLPQQSRYRILHHASRAHFGLQVADYCTWAVLRKWTKGEASEYELIKPALKSEFEIFRRGQRSYY